MARQRRRLARGAALIAGAALMLGLALPVWGSVEINLQAAGSSATVDGVYLQQGPLPTRLARASSTRSRGSSANKDVVQGYNTDYARSSSTRTRHGPRRCSSARSRRVKRRHQPTAVFNLDINQVARAPLLSLDELRLYVVGSRRSQWLRPYGRHVQRRSSTKIFDLGDKLAQLDYRNAPAGSGVSDLSMLVPESKFVATAVTTATTAQAGCVDLALPSAASSAPTTRTTTGSRSGRPRSLPFVQVAEDRDRNASIASTTGRSTSPAPRSPTTCSRATSDDTDYDIDVDQTVTDSNIKVTGTVTITVPAKLPDGDEKAVDAKSSSRDGRVRPVGQRRRVVSSATARCPFTVKAGNSVVCHYTVTGLASAAAGVNTATAIVDGNPVPFSGTANVAAFTPTVTGYSTVNVTDTSAFPTRPPLSGSASGDTTFDDDRDFSCSTDTAKYVNGTYSYTVTNPRPSPRPCLRRCHGHGELLRPGGDQGRLDVLEPRVGVDDH